MEQFYVSLYPEIRLRRKTRSDITDEVSYVLTIKGEGNLSRTEIETRVSRDFYESTLDFINLDPIQKHYLKYENGVEIGVILNDEKFIYAEVEFDSEEEANDYQFPWPELVEKEITNDPNYKMKNYWRKIRQL